MICQKCYVSGRVQGVFYRETTRNKALSLGIKGHAFNLPDGRVEVLMCGTQQQITALESWLWQGSSWSAVSEVQCQGTQYETPENFTTG